MARGQARALQARTRALVQAAKFAIRDVYDAIVELVTNADDRYQILRTGGSIEIEVERRRGKSPSILRVRDFADGMNAGTMDKKLSFLGGRDSGFDRGEKVRGTHSRGAKDVAALGRVLFESITGDGLYHKCEISPFMEFIPYGSSKATGRIRNAVGIAEGSGTLVTIELDNTQSIPQHDTLRKHISSLVSLRGILRDQNRRLVLRDLGQAREHVLAVSSVEGTCRLKETLNVPGYPPRAAAKLVICRAKERFQREPSRFRLGGILAKSKRAIHEATLFDSTLESDPHALWFYGTLTCPYIDDLCNEFDDRFEAKVPPQDGNPTYALDPSRRSGLTRDHPFVKALFGEVLKRLRPLVEEERKREEHERARIETTATRKRLNALEKAALEFMRDFGEDEEAARDPDSRHPESRFMEKGYALSPPFSQLVVGHSTVFWLTVRQETFPEIQTGAAVHIQCLTPEIVLHSHFSKLEPHPMREGVLRATWKVRALEPTMATGLRVTVAPIEAECTIEVLASEADRYSNITGLRFARKRYTVRTDRRKKVRLLAPLDRVQIPTPVAVTIDSKHFELRGRQLLKPDLRRGVAICELWLKSDGKEASGRLTAKHGDDEATAAIASVPPMGAGLSIHLEDIDLVNQRYRWRQNVLEIAARHPSLRRYLGSKAERFSGQDSKHFRVLVAEIVSDAVCALLVRRNVQANAEEYEDADWDTYYAIYSKYMTQFLPIAHRLQCPDG